MAATPMALVDRWNDPNAWSTAQVAPHKQFDRWREFVVDAHMHWAIKSVRCDRFPAFIRQGRFDGFRVTHLTALQGGIVGTRGAHEIAQDHEALYNLIYIADGSILLVIDGQEVTLRPGQFALWDTARPMVFITGENLRQVTFAVPQEQLRRVLPRADDYVGRRLEVTAGVSRLFIDHLLSLDESFGALPRNAAGHVLNATMELLAATLTAKVPASELAGSTSTLLRQILDYVVRHLDQTDLSTRQIAAANGISERHLHRLFEPLQATPATWIRQQRLEHCRRELRDATQLSITDIAYRWGFRDSGTFSKIFRREYGVCPREIRRAGSPKA